MWSCYYSIQCCFDIVTIFIIKVPFDTILNPKCYLVYPRSNCEDSCLNCFRSLICMYLFPPHSEELLLVLFALSFGCSLVKCLMNQPLNLSCLYPTSIIYQYVKMIWRFRYRDVITCHQPPQHPLTSLHDVKLKSRIYNKRSSSTILVL
jgi:hypothetical protein